MDNQERKYTGNWKYTLIVCPLLIAQVVTVAVSVFGVATFVALSSNKVVVSVPDFRLVSMSVGCPDKVAVSIPELGLLCNAQSRNETQK